MAVAKGYGNGQEAGLTFYGHLREGPLIHRNPPWSSYKDQLKINPKPLYRGPKPFQKTPNFMRDSNLNSKQGAPRMWCAYDENARAQVGIFLLYFYHVLGVPCLGFPLKSLYSSRCSARSQRWSSDSRSTVEAQNTQGPEGLTGPLRGLWSINICEQIDRYTNKQHNISLSLYIYIYVYIHVYMYICTRVYTHHIGIMIRYGAWPQFCGSVGP